MIYVATSAKKLTLTDADLARLKALLKGLVLLSSRESANRGWALHLLDCLRDTDEAEFRPEEV